MDSDDLKEIFAGSMGGALATVVEYPLDTIKVRLQGDTTLHRGSLGCLKDIVQHEGVSGLFRGLPAPVIGAAIENATLFLSYRATIGVVQDFFYNKRFEPDTEPYAAVFTAAAISGIVVSQVLTPAELVKCKMQVQNTLPEAQRAYKNSLHCAQSIFGNLGTRGLYRGHVAMLWREALGCGIYFLTFEGVIRNMLRDGQSFTEASPLIHFLGGGCAGVAFWTLVYPIDALKTKVQTGRGDYANLSFRRGMMQLYKREGLRGFTRGYMLTAARAFPGNAVLIAVYEQVNLLWEITHRSRCAGMRSASCVAST